MRRILLIMVLLVAGMITMVVVRVSRLRSANESADTQFTRIGIPSGYSYGRAGFARQLDISPDGKRIVYVAMVGNDTRRLILQTADAASPREISGTDGAIDPSLSPDGRSVVFYSDEKIRKVNLETGEVVALGQVPPTRGVAWLD